MKDSLRMLKEVDPETYEKAFGWFRQCSQLRVYTEENFLCNEAYPLRDALLQHVLQEAMSKWDWYLDRTQVFEGPYRCSIYQVGPPRELIAFNCHGKTAVEAMLNARLQALDLLKRSNSGDL